MTNRDFMNKSITDMSKSELQEVAGFAKNMLDIILKHCTEEEREQFLDGYMGISEMPIRLRK